MEDPKSKEILQVSLRQFREPSQKFVFEDIGIQNLSFDTLQTLVKEKASVSGDVSFIFRGRLLRPDSLLRNQGIKDGSLIQATVGTKKVQQQPEYAKFTELDVQEVVIKFRTVTTSNYHKAGTAEFLNAVYQAHPELRRNITAMAYLRDRTLLSSLGNPDTIRHLAEENRDFVEAASTIVRALTTTEAKAPAPVHEDSDSSDSSDSQPSTSQGTRITSNQVAHALGLALAGNSTNSLANISQRNLTSSQGGSTEPSTPSSASSTNNRISTSMFMNALSEVLRSNRSNNESRGRTDAQTDDTTVAASPIPATPAPSEPSPPAYAAELLQMREMGLMDTQINLQALLVSNGNLEAAINIVLSGGNN